MAESASACSLSLYVPRDDKGKGAPVVKVSIRFPGARPGAIDLTLFTIAATLFFIWCALNRSRSLGDKQIALCVFASAVFACLLFIPCVKKLLLGAPCAFAIGYAFILACVWSRFTPSLNSYIWHDDASMLYAYTAQGLDMLSQGGAFGWNSSLMGGYPAFLDKQYNLALCAAPFAALFGPLKGFNLLVFFSIMIFPFLSYRCIRTWLPGERTAAVWGIYFSCAMINSFFWCFINNCSFNSMLGLDFYVLNLLLVRRFLDERPYASFCLALSVALTCYAHLSYFVLSIITMIIIAMIAPGRMRNTGRMAVVLAVAFICTLPYSWQMIRYRHYFVEDMRHYAPPVRHFSLPGILTFSIRSFRDNLMPDLWGGLSFIPVFLVMCLRRRGRGPQVLLYAYCVLALVIAVGMAVTDQAFMRMSYGLSIFWILLISYAGSETWGVGRVFQRLLWGGLLFVLITFVWIASPAFNSWTTPRLKDLKSYNRTFFEKMTGLSGNLILFEGQGGLNHATESNLGRRSEKWSDDVHMAGVVALETGKNLFSTNIDGFHPSVFRANAITCGTYKGRFLSEYPPGVITALLKKWGIRYLVVWSSEARAYFVSQKEAYRCIWSIDTEELKRAGFEPVRWEIYEFLDADPRSVVGAHGGGEVKTVDYFSKILRVHGAVKGEKMVLRMNYFPSWRAFWKGGEVQLVNEEGQMGIWCPESGDITIYLQFPKYRLITMLIVVTLVATLLISRKGYV